MGQLIDIKTVPLAEGDQFMVFPAQHHGMGGVGIALEDRLHKPFINPAAGGQLSGLHLFSVPSLYNITKKGGGAGTLGLGTLYGSKGWFSGGAFAIQQLKLTGSTLFQSSVLPGMGTRVRGNNYFYGLLGRHFTSDKQLSLAGGIFWANLAAVEGVELLYPNSQRVEQTGHLLDLRLGMYKEFPGHRTLEALLLHNRLDMTHNVYYSNSYWGNPIDDLVTARMDIIPTSGLEKNQDMTNTWGVHLQYRQPLGEEHWYGGGLFTVNYKWHPKIPNYELMNIPKDPGTSWAYRFGLGVGWNDAETSFGCDLIYEPIWSHTWAAENLPVFSNSGSPIPQEDKTVDNYFSFSNAILRVGLEQQIASVAMQLGLLIRHIHYHLDQTDFLLGTVRNLKEHWTEWTPTWGLGFQVVGCDIRYAGRLTIGTGQPGLSAVGWRRIDPGGIGIPARAAYSSDYILAPAGDLTVRNTLVISHQVTISVPIR